MTSIEILATKRLKGELRNLEKNRESFYQVVQDKHDKFIFYFLLRGDAESVYKNGYYIGKITLPTDYPTSPGDFYMLTPSGRFTIDSKICLTNSGYHPGLWSPIWNIQHMVIGFVSVFLSDTTDGVSHICESHEERELKAENSVQYNMKHHKDIFMLFDQFVKEDGTIRTYEEVDKYIMNMKHKNINNCISQIKN